MFERYTEKARRVIFFARYEASQYGSPNIESEHLLLGLLREDRRLEQLVFSLVGQGEGIRKEIEAQIKPQPRVSTALDIPLTQECKRILNFAANEADTLKHAHIHTGHLLLGILREDNCLGARVLANHGVSLREFREKIASHISQSESGVGAPSGSPLPGHHYPLPASVASRIQSELAVEQFLRAWATGDAKKVATFFASHGQLWDARGEQWLGPAQVEKGLAAHFASSEQTELAPDVRDVKCVTVEVSVATLDWEARGQAKKANQAALRMVLMLCDSQHGWQIVSAHLAFLDPNQEKRNR